MRLKLIDGSGYVFRAFYALPPLARSDGTPVGAVYGYCTMLSSIIDSADCSHIAVVMDGGRSGREQIDPAYKANRAPKPPELTAQLAAVVPATESYGVSIVRVAGAEADDVIATYARRLSGDGHEVEILSMDKDLLQLLTLPGVSIWDPLKKQVVSQDVCRQRLGVRPDQVADYLAIVGDSADNIPGIPGVGEKTAAALLACHGTLDRIIWIAENTPSLLACADRFKPKVVDGVAHARRARRLVELQDVPGLPAPETLACRGPDPERLLGFLREQEFMVMAREVKEKYGLAW